MRAPTCLHPGVEKCMFALFLLLFFFWPNGMFLELISVMEGMFLLLLDREGAEAVECCSQKVRAPHHGLCGLI